MYYEIVVNVAIFVVGTMLNYYAPPTTS